MFPRNKIVVLPLHISESLTTAQLEKVNSNTPLQIRISNLWGCWLLRSSSSPPRHLLTAITLRRTMTTLPSPLATMPFLPLRTTALLRRVRCRCLKVGQRTHHHTIPRTPCTLHNTIPLLPCRGAATTTPDALAKRHVHRPIEGRGCGGSAAARGLAGVVR